MALGDRYLATVEVTQVADTEYRWDGAGVGIFSDEIKSLEKTRDPLPTAVGSVVKYRSSGTDVYAMRREDGRWVTTRGTTGITVFLSRELNETDWSLVR